MEVKSYQPLSTHSPLSTQCPCPPPQSSGQSLSQPSDSQSQSLSHSQLACHLALQTLQDAEVFCGLDGRDGVEKCGLVSVASGSGGRFSSREMIFAIKLVFAVEAPSTDTCMVRVVGSRGVCHFAQTTWEPPAGITMSFTV